MKVVAELAPGSVFAGHRIEGVLGRGGMGVVYRALQLALGRVVALKVIAPELLDDAATQERFLREARAAASIDHPHVIPILHAGEEDGTGYLVMRLVDGEDVRTLVRAGGALEPGRAARIAAQVADALDVIHAAGLVHRDVKPANVLLGAGDHVYITDFGLAKHVVSSGGSTRSGQWVGTLDFVAPEQIRGLPVDARTDVYALGGLLFYMLTGTAPFTAHEGDEAKLWAHLTEAPPPATALRPELPAAFDAVLARAMAKEPGDRYASAGIVGRAALAAARGELLATDAPTLDAAAPPPPAFPPAARAVPVGRRRPRRAWAAIAVLAAVVAVAGLAVLALLDRGAGGPGHGSGSSAASPPRGRAVGARDPGVRVGATIGGVGLRPNAVAISDGIVWVSSAGLARVVRMNAATGRRLPTAPKVGRTAVAMAAADRVVWLALKGPGRLVRLTSRTARETASIPLPGGEPVAVDARPDAVWVAVRGAPDRVLRFDPGTLQPKGTVDVPEGVQAIALGSDGDLWIADRSEPTVVRIDHRTGRELRRVRVGEPAYDLAFGAGYAWASQRNDGTVDRIDPRTGAVVSVLGPQRPTQLAVAGGLVFVAGFVDHTVEVIAPRNARPVGRPLPAGLNPFAVAGDDRHVWVTSVGTNSATRLDLR